MTKAEYWYFNAFRNLVAARAYLRSAEQTDVLQAVTVAGARLKALDALVAAQECRAEARRCRDLSRQP